MATEPTHHERMLAHLHKGVHHLGTHHQSIHEQLKEFIELQATPPPEPNPSDEV